MSYTNSTPNLHLPQYIATDKPTYLGDWNASMQTIDTVITSTQATANGANSTAISANAVAQAAQTSANTANSKADNNTTAIQQINDNNSFKLYKTTNLATTASTNYSQANGNNSLLQFGLNYSFQGGAKPNGTLVNDNMYCPLFSIPDNILDLEAGTATDSDKHVVIFGVSIYTNGANWNIGALRIWYDGTNTVIAFQIINKTYQALTALLIGGNFTINNLNKDSTATPTD